MNKSVFIIFQQLNKQKKMALKFNLEDFKELDTPNLLKNIWEYSECLKDEKYKNSFYIYETYRKYCIYIARRRWRKVHIAFFNKLIINITNNNKNFIDLSQYSSFDLQHLMSDLEKIHKNMK